MLKINTYTVPVIPNCNLGDYLAGSTHVMFVRIMIRNDKHCIALTKNDIRGAMARPQVLPLDPLD
jgi:hypothetical protein